MRVIIAFEGKHTVPGQFLEKDSIKWGDGPFPITGLENNMEKLTGWAKDIQRDEDGCLTADIYNVDENLLALLEHGDVAMTIYCRGVGDTYQDQVRTVHSAELKGLYPTMCVPWVGLKPGDKLKGR